MKFGVREICNVVLKAKEQGAYILGKERFKGEPILWFDSLKASGIEGTGETVYARGGRGNTKLLSWNGDKEVTFTMEDALISPLSLAVLVGANEVQNAITYKHIMETVLVKNGNPDYSYTPASEKPIFHCNPEDVSEKITVLKNGDTVFVDYYTEVNGTSAKSYKAKATTQIDISPESFGSNFYLEAETLFRDSDGRDYAAEFIIPSCRVQSNFSFNLSSTGDPSTFTFTMDAFPDTIIGATDKVLCAIQVSEDEYRG